MSGRKTIALATSVAVIIGLGDLPYGYYNLLRLLICAFSLFLVFGDTPIVVVWQRWLTAACAVLYNPILPVRIGHKAVWIVVNVFTVAWFWHLAMQPSRKVGA